MAYVTYNKIVDDLLKHNSFFRHLLSKAKNRCKVKITLSTGDVIVGILKSVDAYFRGLELFSTNGKMVYINWRHVVKIEVFDVNLEEDSD